MTMSATKQCYRAIDRILASLCYGNVNKTACLCTTAFITFTELWNIQNSW